MEKSGLDKIYGGKSRADAVRLFCAECMGYDGHRIKGNSNVSYLSARLEVTHCQVKECPLWPYRLRVIESTKVPETIRLSDIPSAQFSTDEAN